MRNNIMQTLIIIFLVIGCIVMGGLIIYSNTKRTYNDKPNVKLPDSIEREEIEQVNVEGPYIEVTNGRLPQELNISDKFLKNTIHLFDTAYTGKYFGYYFKEDKKLVKEMEQNVINNIALQGFANKLLQIGIENNETCVDKKEILEYAKTVLDKNVQINDNTEEIFNDTGDFVYRDGKYCGKPLGGKDPVGDNIFHRIVGYSKGSVYLDIYTKYTFCQTVYNEKTKKPDCVFRTSLNTEIPENYLGRTEFSLSPSKEMFDKANTYKFRFKISKDNLYFYSVEKVIK